MLVRYALCTIARIDEFRNDGADANVVGGKPSGIHFNDARSVGAGLVQIERPFFHGNDLSDASAGIYEGSVQVDKGVFHPHRNGARCGENKKHAVIRGQKGAVHEARAVLNGRARHFKFNDFAADFDGLHFVKRLCG